jgi:hypothetical protein
VSARVAVSAYPPERQASHRRIFCRIWAIRARQLGDADYLRADQATADLLSVPVAYLFELCIDEEMP